MNLTFKGFLRGYCRELTQLQTDSLRTLCAKVVTEAPAAAEALMTFAAVQGKARYLASLSKRTWLEDDYREAASVFDANPDVEAYLASEAASERYRKVWNAYRAKRNAIASDRRIIALMRKETLTALERAGLTVYRLCKNLGLNFGNMYAYLNGGDPAKVSKETARRIMDHAKSLI